MNNLVKDKNELDQIWKTLNSIFYLERNFPDQVFRENYINYFAMEHPNIYSNDFWEGYQKSQLFKEEDIISVAAIRIHPDKEAKLYSCFKIPATASAVLYFDLYDYDNHKVQYSYISIHYPSSLKWAIWSSFELELSIIGFNKDMGADKIPLDPDWFPVNSDWISIETAIGIIPNAIREELRPEIISTFKANYLNK